MTSARARTWLRGGTVGLVAAVATLGLAVPAQAADPVVLNILTVNDFHGRVNADTVKFAGTIEKLKAEDGANGANSLLIGAGDFIGASEFASAVSQDQPTIDIFNELGMAASAVGNHEFDQGWADLRDRVINGKTNATWDYLGANVYDSTGTPILPEYGIYEVAGVKVGVIGAVTEETSALVSPAGIQGLTFGDPVAAINRVADQLSDGNPANGEADVIIATTHEGAPDGAQTLAANTAISAAFAGIVNNVSPKVAAIINGHTHQAYAYDAPVPGVAGKTRPILQTGSYAANVGQIQLTVDRDSAPLKTVTTYTVKNVARVTTADADLIAQYPVLDAVNKTVQAALAYAMVIGDQPVGTLTSDITTAMIPAAVTPNQVYPGFDRDDRAKESTLGTLVADALLATLAPPERGGAQIAIVNPGGLRAELAYAASANPADSTGTILYAEANSVLPFVNNLATIDLTGAQLKTLLEQQWQRDQNGNVPTRPYLALGTSTGFSYTFDASLPEGSRITSMVFDGAPIDPAATYRIGTFTFLTSGGDNFRVFTQGADYRDSGLVDRDAWIAYLQANKPVSPDFRKHSASVSGLSASPTPGVAQTLAVGSLDLTSIGSPANTSLTAQFAKTADGAGAVAVGSATVAAGAASIGVTFPSSTAGASGFLILTAQPSGTRVVVPVQVGLAPSTVTATASAVQYGSAPKVAVTVASPAGTPAGTVTVSEGGTTLGTATLSKGKATVTLGKTALQPGTHTLTVSYSGGGTIGASTTTVGLVVNKAASATVGVASGLIVRKGAAVKVSVVTLANGGVPADGPVTISSGGKVVGTGTLVNGRASVSITPFTSAGIKLLTVSYGGSATVAASSGPALVLVL